MYLICVYKKYIKFYIYLFFHITDLISIIYINYIYIKMINNNIFHKRAMYLKLIRLFFEKKKF